MLGLQTNFDDFHGVDNGYSFGNTGGKTSCWVSFITVWLTP
jgi:hypothetical protein